MKCEEVQKYQSKPHVLALTTAKDFVEESPQLALLAREVELGVVSQRLGQVQLDVPEEINVF